MFRNPDDEPAPYAMMFDASRWTEIAPVANPRIPGWRYLEAPPMDEPAGVDGAAGFSPPRADEGK